MKKYTLKRTNALGMKPSFRVLNTQSVSSKNDNGGYECLDNASSITLPHYVIRAHLATSGLKGLQETLVKKDPQCYFLVENMDVPMDGLTIHTGPIPIESHDKANTVEKPLSLSFIEFSNASELLSMVIFYIDGRELYIAKGPASNISSCSNIPVVNDVILDNKETHFYCFDVSQKTIYVTSTNTEMSDWLSSYQGSYTARSYTKLEKNVNDYYPIDDLKASWNTPYPTREDAILSPLFSPLGPIRYLIQAALSFFKAIGHLCKAFFESTALKQDRKTLAKNLFGVALLELFLAPVSPLIALVISLRRSVLFFYPKSAPAASAIRVDNEGDINIINAHTLATPAKPVSESGADLGMVHTTIVPSSMGYLATNTSPLSSGEKSRTPEFIDAFRSPLTTAYEGHTNAINAFILATPAKPVSESGANLGTVHATIDPSSMGHLATNTSTPSSGEKSRTPELIDAFRSPSTIANDGHISPQTEPILPPLPLSADLGEDAMPEIERISKRSFSPIKLQSPSQAGLFARGHFEPGTDTANPTASVASSPFQVARSNNPG